MATNFDRWEKDPFFSAAEEVQESADRMESNYRTWLHEAKLDTSVDLDDIRRDLQTSLGTAKWQLEEFERAVRSSYVDNSSKDVQTRHYQFIDAISNQIAKVENSLRETAVGDGKSGNALPWVRLDEGERDELAQFLTGFTSVELNHSTEKRELEMVPDCVKSSCKSEESKADKVHGGHRRTASAAEFTSWQVPVVDEESQRNTSEGKTKTERGIPRIVSFSGFLNKMEPMTKIKSSKNGFRKWKLADRHQASDTLPLQSPQLPRGIDECYERSKSCLDSCDESYDKHLYGWLGSFQRQIQRSQYQIQYGRPVKVAMWASLATCMLVIFVLNAI